LAKARYHQKKFLFQRETAQAKGTITTSSTTAKRWVSGRERMAAVPANRRKAGSAVETPEKQFYIKASSR